MIYGAIEMTVIIIIISSPCHEYRPFDVGHGLVSRRTRKENKEAVGSR